MTMTDTELESRVVATLRTKSAQVHAAPREFDPDLVALTPLAPRGRRRVPVLIAAAVALVIAVAIGVTLVLVDRYEAADPAGEPKGPVSQLQIVALPSLSYQSREFTTEPGLNEIEFVSHGGTHTLTFADPALADFHLSSWDNRTERATVNLEAGRDYVVHDVIPGHRDAGEVAVIHVTDGPAGPTVGPFPPSETVTTLPTGGVDLNTFPDYLQVGDVNGQPGFVKRLDLFRRGPPPLIFAANLTTVIGRVYSDGEGSVTTTTAP
jgi:hypothetical protein